MINLEANKYRCIKKYMDITSRSERSCQDKHFSPNRTLLEVPNRLSALKKNSG